MGTRHVNELLSAAYDDALTAAERRRYDEHIATCQECANAAEQLRHTLDAVRALPAARMPQRVGLPRTPPQPERRAGFRLPGVLGGLPRLRLTPAWSAGTMVAAGLIAVVVVVRATGGGGSSSTTSSVPALGFDQKGAAGAAPNRAASGALVGTCPLPLAVVSAKPRPAATDPPGFTNRVSVATPQRPGQALVLATTSSHYAAGSQVLVYAALTSTTGGAVVIPCVTLHQQGAVAYASPARDQAGAAGGSGTSAPGAATPATPVPGAASSVVGTVLTPQQVDAFAPYALLPPLAVASSTSAALANLPLQVIQIPANLAPGTQLRLIALVPAGLPGSGDAPAIEAVLTVDVS
jgi:anti-sigma factor RsiW